jgi:hypothetical protein
MTSVDGTAFSSLRRTIFGRCQTNNRKIVMLASDGYDANDLKRTLPVPAHKKAAGGPAALL